MAAKKRFHSENVRRTKSMEEGGMIESDFSQVANLPQQAMYKPWPGSYSGMPDDTYDDTIEGIDRQMGKDESQAKRFLQPRKY